MAQAQTPPNECLLFGVFVFFSFFGNRTGCGHVFFPLNF